MVRVEEGWILIIVKGFTSSSTSVGHHHLHVVGTLLIVSGGGPFAVSQHLRQLSEDSGNQSSSQERSSTASRSGGSARRKAPRRLAGKSRGGGSHLLQRRPPSAQAANSRFHAHRMGCFTCCRRVCLPIGRRHNGFDGSDLNGGRFSNDGSGGCAVGALSGLCRRGGRAFGELPLPHDPWIGMYLWFYFLYLDIALYVRTFTNSSAWCELPCCRQGLFSCVTSPIARSVYWPCCDGPC